MEISVLLNEPFSVTLKGALRSFWNRRYNQRSKLNKQAVFVFVNKLNELADVKGQHSFLPFYFCLYVADPATFLASNSVLFILSLRTACLLSYGKK